MINDYYADVEMPFSDYRLHTLTADTAIDDILLR
jgi:hypothetical protein